MFPEDLATALQHEHTSRLKTGYAEISPFIATIFYEVMVETPIDPQFDNLVKLQPYVREFTRFVLFTSISSVYDEGNPVASPRVMGMKILYGQDAPDFTFAQLRDAWQIASAEILGHQNGLWGALLEHLYSCYIFGLTAVHGDSKLAKPFDFLVNPGDREWFEGLLKMIDRAVGNDYRWHRSHQLLQGVVD